MGAIKGCPVSIAGLYKPSAASKSPGSRNIARIPERNPGVGGSDELEVHGRSFGVVSKACIAGSHHPGQMNCKQTRSQSAIFIYLHALTLLVLHLRGPPKLHPSAITQRRQYYIRTTDQPVNNTSTRKETRPNTQNPCSFKCSIPKLRPIPSPTWVICYAVSCHVVRLFQFLSLRSLAQMTGLGGGGGGWSN